MGLALYRKYRSKSLDEIVGQSHVTALLRRAIDQGKIGHAYLLTGPKGVGKTSIARILAHEINQLPYSDESTHLDIIEIDAASNNSVEDVRSLRERVMIAPVSAKYKVYIIDEVHMLSKAAFNALLKTLEEPPAHIVFILATTDSDKLPATIISRVQRFNFRTITPADAATHLRMIADKESIAIDDDALTLIAEHGRGSFRDSIGLLDQLQNTTDGTVTRALVEQILGLSDVATIEQLIAAHGRSDLAAVVALIDESERRGTQPAILAEQLISEIRRTITNRPHLIRLLDHLLEVARSSWPHIKLLTALTSDMPAVTVAVTAQPTVIPAKPEVTSPPTPVVITPEPIVEEAPVKEASAQSPEPVKPTKKKSVAATASNVEFSWDAFLADVKETSSGAYTLLHACGYELDGNRLTIYAGRKFAKTKLDTVVPMLSASLAHVGSNALEITITASAQPPKDRQTADILAIMGGGEEISL